MINCLKILICPVVISPWNIYLWCHLCTLYKENRLYDFNQSGKNCFLVQTPQLVLKMKKKKGMERTGLYSVCPSQNHLRLKTFRYCYIKSLAEWISVVQYHVVSWRTSPMFQLVLGHSSRPACTIRDGLQWW